MGAGSGPGLGGAGGSIIDNGLKMGCGLAAGVVAGTGSAAKRWSSCVRATALFCSASFTCLLKSHFLEYTRSCAGTLGKIPSLSPSTSAAQNCAIFSKSLPHFVESLPNKEISFAVLTGRYGRRCRPHPWDRWTLPLKGNRVGIGSGSGAEKGS